MTENVRSTIAIRIQASILVGMVAGIVGLGLFCNQIFNPTGKELLEEYIVSPMPKGIKNIELIDFAYAPASGTDFRISLTADTPSLEALIAARLYETKDTLDSNWCLDDATKHMQNREIYAYGDIMSQRIILVIDRELGEAIIAYDAY